MGGVRKGAGRPKGTKRDLPPLPSIDSKEDVLHILKLVNQYVYEGRISHTKGKAMADIIRTYYDISENIDYTVLQERLESLLATSKQRKTQKPSDPSQ